LITVVVFLVRNFGLVNRGDCGAKPDDKLEVIETKPPPDPNRALALELISITSLSGHVSKKFSDALTDEVVDALSKTEIELQNPDKLNLLRLRLKLIRLLPDVKKILTDKPESLSPEQRNTLEEVRDHLPFLEISINDVARLLDPARPILVFVESKNRNLGDLKDKPELLASLLLYKDKNLDELPHLFLYEKTRIRHLLTQVQFKEKIMTLVGDPEKTGLSPQEKKDLSTALDDGAVYGLESEEVDGARTILFNNSPLKALKVLKNLENISDADLEVFSEINDSLIKRLVKEESKQNELKVKRDGARKRKLALEKIVACKNTPSRISKENRDFFEDLKTKDLVFLGIKLPQIMEILDEKLPLFTYLKDGDFQLKQIESSPDVFKILNDLTEAEIKALPDSDVKTRIAKLYDLLERRRAAIRLANEPEFKEENRDKIREAVEEAVVLNLPEAELNKLKRITGNEFILFDQALENYKRAKSEFEKFDKTVFSDPLKASFKAASEAFIKVNGIPKKPAEISITDLKSPSFAALVLPEAMKQFEEELASLRPDSTRDSLNYLEFLGAEANNPDLNNEISTLKNSFEAIQRYFTKKTELYGMLMGFFNEKPMNGGEALRVSTELAGYRSALYPKFNDRSVPSFAASASGDDIKTQACGSVFRDVQNKTNFTSLSNPDFIAYIEWFNQIAKCANKSGDETLDVISSAQVDSITRFLYMLKKIGRITSSKTI
jgi:hypothetical protein